MKAVVQRVKSASVNINKVENRSIGAGLLMLLGIRNDDTEEDIRYMVNKTANLRIFNDENALMNRSLIDVFDQPQCLVISNFTIYGDCKKGRRPSFIDAASPEIAIPIYNHFISELKLKGIEVICGEFGAHMEIGLVNDGPVTLILSSDHLKQNT